MAIDRRAAYYRKLPHQHDPENFLARYDRGLQLQAKWRSGSWRRA